ncbi:MAG TPA: hypothetical protein EYQ26_05940 [Rhodospirillales bacterium]|nr:hypothetical protein [Rhodospirillales bacterium]HIL74875.1 hypothetical protein [Rhodospirillales bacterium]
MPKDLIKNFITEFIKHNGFPKYINTPASDNVQTERNRVLYSGPYWGVEELQAAVEGIMEGTWLVSGEKVRKFENEFSRKFNLGYSVMVNSGSSANLVMIAAVKEFLAWPDGSEIICSVVGFPTTFNPIIQNNLTPVFADIDLSDLNFSPDEIEKKISPQTKAIFVSPVLGNCGDFDKIINLASKYKLEILLDNCDSLGSKYKNTYLSDFAIASSCSFYPAHHISVGEGGMVSSKHLKLIEITRSFAWWGRDCYCVGSANMLPNGTCKNRFDHWLGDDQPVIDHKYLFKRQGYNLKPLDFQGRIGSVQLSRFDHIHKVRRNNFKILSNIFSRIEGVKGISERHDCEISWFGVPFVCETAQLKQDLVSWLESNSIQTRNYFAGNILSHPGYNELDNEHLYPNAQLVLKLVFFVGCSPVITKEKIEYIDEKIIEFCNNIR